MSHNLLAGLPRTALGARAALQLVASNNPLRLVLAGGDSGGLSCRGGRDLFCDPDFAAARQFFEHIARPRLTSKLSTLVIGGASGSTVLRRKLANMCTCT